MQPDDPAYEQRTRDSFARQNAMQTLGAVLESVAPGRVTITMAHRDSLTQQHGFIHAGMLAAALDSASGYAAFSLMPADAAVLTIEFKINLTAPADGQRAIAVGEVIRTGRTITVCRIDAYVDKGGRRTHCATGLSTLMTVTGRAAVKD